MTPTLVFYPAGLSTRAQKCSEADAGKQCPAWLASDFADLQT